MESWRASMIPIIEDSSEPNGFEAIATSDLNPRTLSFSIIETIVIAASKVKHPYRWFEKLASSQFCLLQSSTYRKWATFRTERSLSSVLSEVTGSSMSSENILSFLRALSIPTFVPKSLPAYIKFKSTQVMTLLPLSHTVYRNGSIQILNTGNLCIDTS
jgi:hypothetical protein